MRRYFFDVVGRRSQYDYRGHVLPTLEKARQLAELIALDFSVEEGDTWAGCKINVRSAEGCEFFSIPLQESCCAAA